MTELKIVPPLAHHSDARRWRPSSRRGLDRDQVIRAATRFIDAHGLTQLTMRRLGTELDVEAMALYRYVAGREALLDGVAEELIDELLDDDRMVVHPPAWQAYLQELAHAVRDLALEHPRVFPIIATRPPAAPWLRPPLRSLRFVETFLSGLDACGFSDAAIVYTYRAFSTFLLGHLLLEVSGPAAELEEDDAGSASRRPTALDPYPQLARRADSLAADHSRQEFEESLESLLDRIQTSIAVTHRRGPA